METKPRKFPKLSPPEHLSLNTYDGRGAPLLRSTRPTSGAG